MEKSHLLDPLRHKKQEKEKGGTLKTTPSLEESSLAIMAHFEIDAAYAHYNAIDTLYLKKHSNLKKSGYYLNHVNTTMEKLADLLR
jgi:hypothetical protein